jgi:hypothetical protein
MAGRALIIGIEQYPQSVDLAQQITGATSGAEHFFEWVTATKHIAPANAFVCASGGSFPGATRFSTAREAIVDAMAALVAAGQDQTEELFVFFSGHGYCFQESLEKRAIDVLVAGDFESAAKSGTKCLKLQEVQEKLYAILGGQHHYYFVDACRTLIRDDEIDPIALGRKLGRAAQRGRPTKYTLYSTAYGTPAAITSDFTPALVDGLHGKGRAKGFTPAGALFVQFPLLCSYVQERVRTQKMDQNKDGNGEGYIVEVVPVPSYRCSIEISGAAATDNFEARLQIAGNPAFQHVTPFTGPAFQLPFSPANLVLEVFEAGQPLVRTDPPLGTPIDFFDDCKVVFRKGPGAAAGTTLELTLPPGTPPMAPPLAAPATIRSAAPADVRTHAVNLHTGDSRDIGANDTADLPPGDYEITVHERGMPISREVRTLASGSHMGVTDAPLDPIRESIVVAVQGNVTSGVVAFSETVGDIANRDLGLWLTLMGAAHILRDPGTFSKLRSLPLDDVSRIPPNETAVYVLGATGAGQPPRVGVNGAWDPARPVPTLTGVFQSTTRAAAGSQLVTIDFGRAEARTFASYCLPNRLTFIVCSPGSRGQLRVNQFLLPMFHLQALQPPFVQDRIREDPRPLRIIRTAYLFQSQFARAYDIRPADPEDQDVWGELLHGKWFDPVMSLLVCYEILRRGNDPDRLIVRNNVLPNLDHYFGGIPDVAALAAMLGFDRAVPKHPPLFREGLLAFPDWEDDLPIGADKLDFNYTWTAWRGVRR